MTLEASMPDSSRVGVPARRKARLTITLSRQLLEDLDRTIDGETVRNRSHAIERLIRRGLRPSVAGAVILAGGATSSGDVPALRTINGRPLIAQTISHLIGHGIRDFLILAGDRQAEIEQILGGGESLGGAIHYLHEREPSGTAGAVRLAEAHLGEGPFLVIHGDVLTDINITDFIEFHRNEGATATMAVKPRHSELEYGRVMLQGNRITEFFESGSSGGISIINTGVYLFERAIFEMIDEYEAVMLERGIFPELARRSELSAFFFQGIWFDIGSQANYKRAKQRWKDKGEAAR